MLVGSESGPKERGPGEQAERLTRQAAARESGYVLIRSHSPNPSQSPKEAQAMLFSTTSTHDASECAEP